MWWSVHERDAPELVPDDSLRAIFDQGIRVGELARERFPGGVLIASDEHRVDATRCAIDSGATTLFEASFIGGDVFAAVDVLLREADGWRLIEVKSTTSVKDEHVADAAVQAFVLEQAGLRVHVVEIMHLNRACAHPDLSNLFMRVDVTSRVLEQLPRVPTRVSEQVTVLRGPLPSVATGAHCARPYPCPFQGRCFGPLPEHHVSTLYRGRRHAADFLAEGVERIQDIVVPLDGIRERQRRAVQSGQLVVEGDLSAALAPFAPPIAFLDFETVGLAIPCWPGCSPYDTVPVQFSVHAERASGIEHLAWLAEGPHDPRRSLAIALLDACLGARTVVAYNAAFERRIIGDLATACPDLSAPLMALSDRVVDLLRVVREHVYHPDFDGSFGLKSVLPALTGQGYEDLAIAGGGLASAELVRLLFEPLHEDERHELRRQLLAYCERDTWGLVHLLGRLRDLATPAT
jgi:hypothetical protein